MKPRSIMLAALAGGAYYLVRRRRGRAVAHAGIADLDPEPLAQVAGEGIDLDANESAHSEVAEQREKLDAITRSP